MYAWHPKYTHVLDTRFEVANNLEWSLVADFGRRQTILDIDSCHSRFSPESLV